jgi:hypothetical protein
MRSEAESRPRKLSGGNKIGFKVRLVAPYFPDIPPEIKESWVSGSKKAVPKTYQGLKKAIKTPKDFKEKIAKPVEKSIASFIDPKYISKKGLTYDQMMNKTRESLGNAGKHYLPKKNADYQIRRNEEKVELKQTEYARSWCQVIGPLKGYKKGGIKGLGALGVMALCGDPELKNFLKKGIDTIEGTPTQSLRTGSGLGNQIVHWGSRIIERGYKEQDIKQANEALNQLVNEYRRPEIVPFSPNGNSYINFIAVEIPNPTKPGEKIKQLGLDIQVSKK